MVSTNIGCNHGFSLAEPTPKVTHVDRKHLMVACTNMCGWAISYNTHGTQGPNDIRVRMMCPVDPLNRVHYTKALFPPDVNIRIYNRTCLKQYYWDRGVDIELESEVNDLRKVIH